MLSSVQCTCKQVSCFPTGLFRLHTYTGDWIMLSGNVSTNKLQWHICSWSIRDDSFRKLVCCFAQRYRRCLQVRKEVAQLCPSSPWHKSKNTDVLATTEKDTASTTGSSQVYGLNYSFMLYLHTWLHSFKCHLLQYNCVSTRSAGKHRGQKEGEDFADYTTTFRRHLYLLET